VKFVETDIEGLRAAEDQPVFSEMRRVDDKKSDMTRMV
jgi:hypothetical protein